MTYYSVIDTVSRNVLGEFGTLEHANWLVSELTGADPAVKQDLEIREFVVDETATDRRERSGETVSPTRA